MCTRLLFPPPGREPANEATLVLYCIISELCSQVVEGQILRNSAASIIYLHNTVCNIYTYSKSEVLFVLDLVLATVGVQYLNRMLKLGIPFMTWY